MKTITVREFLHTPALTKSLHPGQTLLVTDKGEPSLTITKVGKRPRLTENELFQQAKQLVKRKGPKINFTKMIREMNPK